MNPSLCEYKTTFPLEASHLPNAINFNYNSCRLFLCKVQKYGKKYYLSAFLLFHLFNIHITFNKQIVKKYALNI